MIIKKKKLDILTGVQQPEVPEQFDNIQDDGYAYNYEEQSPQADFQQEEYQNTGEYSDNNYNENIKQYSENSHDEQPDTQNSYSDNEYNEQNSSHYQLEEENSQYRNNLQEQSLQTDNSQSVTQQKSLEEDDINLFDLDNIDFSQRQERRRGDRRRGFRRVDDRNLVSRAHEEAEAIRESARKEGYQAGLEQAQEDVMQLRQAIENFVGVKQEVFEYIAPNILDISVDIAKKIIKKEIEQGPQVLINTVVDVLKTSLSKEETKVTLRVNPSEVNEIKQAIPDIIDLAGIDTKIVVLADDEVSEGGCQITTTNGIVDATIESRMRVVMQALREL